MVFIKHSKLLLKLSSIFLPNSSFTVLITAQVRYRALHGLLSIYFYLLTLIFLMEHQFSSKVVSPKKKRKRKRSSKAKGQDYPSPVTFSHYNEGQTRPLNSVVLKWYRIIT